MEEVLFSYYKDKTNNPNKKTPTLKKMRVKTNT
jgi:hypothetical protein